MYYNPRLDLLGRLSDGILLEIGESEFMVLTKEWIYVSKL